MVSIHAPARGATLIWRIHSRTGSFQSTRPRGARPRQPALQSSITTFQSTRPRGARRDTSSTDPHHRQFQSTRPRGARLRSLKTCRAARAFQSTRPRGARPSPSAPPGMDRRFNPRARAGRDDRRRGNNTIRGVSIHAPARGATCIHLRCVNCPNVSIHAPARGATYYKQTY